MKKRSKIILYQLIALLVVGFAISSCSDNFFNQKDGELITPDQHYKSTIDAQVSMAGAFVPLQNVIPNLIMIDGLRSDLMDVRPNADLYFKAINDQTFTLDNPYIDPSDYYKVIINVNEVLANISKVQQADKNFDSITAFSYRGAMIGLRAWSYFTLVKLYGEAAMIDKNLTSLPENLHQTILTKYVMIDTLINQLKPYIYDPKTAKYAEMKFSTPLPSIKAVLGELYLEKNDYANAAKYLKAACESYGNDTKMYKVDKVYSKDGWKTIFNSALSQSTENISIVPYNSVESQFNPLPKWMLNTDQFMVKPTKLLVDSFKAQIPAQGSVPGDIFRGAGISNNTYYGITYDTISTGEAWISKYSVDKGQPYSTDIIISRAADLHLLLAEALNRSGDEKTALILLNAGWAGEAKKPADWAKWSGNIGIRGRASLKSKVVPDSINHVLFAGEERTKYVEDLIMDERVLELAFEGKRFSDLIRVALRRGDPAYLADKVAAKFSDPAQAAAIKSKLMVESNWYLPYKK